MIYHIYPSSFQDSDGDGIGDLEGIRSRLDYVKACGFNTIWLSPVFESPFEDGGYDITDYYKVDPRFGTNTQLVDSRCTCKGNPHLPRPRGRTYVG